MGGLDPTGEPLGEARQSGRMIERIEVDIEQAERLAMRGRLVERSVKLPFRPHKEPAARAEGPRADGGIASEGHR